MTNNDAVLHLLEAAHTYFEGEKIEALVFILPIGLLGLVFGIWLLTEDQGTFTKGVAIPFLVMGLVMSSVGAVVGFRTPAQVNHLERSLSTSPQSAVAQELNRMEKVNQAWGTYLLIWGLFGSVGLLLRFVTKSDLLHGIGIALVFFAGVGLLVDGFAERRTHPYMDALKASEQSQ